MAIQRLSPETPRPFENPAILKLFLGKQCRSCQKIFTGDEPMSHYQHSQGWKIPSMPRLQWIYIQCGQCGYQTSLAKLGFSRPNLPEIPEPTCPPDGPRFPVPSTIETIQWVALDRNILAVAMKKENLPWGAEWCAWVGVVPGHHHDEEYKAVLESGSKLSQPVAKAIFPQYSTISYRS